MKSALSVPSLAGTPIPFPDNLSATIKHLIRQGDEVGLRDLFTRLCKQWPVESMGDRAYEYFRMKLLTGGGRIAQIAIEEGLPVDEANALSEKYFRMVDRAQDIEQVRDAGLAMIYDCAKQVARCRSRHYSRHVRKMIQYIQKHYAEDFSLEVVADHADLSPNYATTLFRKETGRNLKDELRQVRVEKACEYLSRSDLSISEVARLTGFKQANHFARTFKLEKGMSPREYRNSVPAN